MESFKNTVRDNLISNREPAGVSSDDHEVLGAPGGVKLYRAKENAVLGNTVLSAGFWGVLVFESKDNAVTGNAVDDNVTGIWLIPLGPDPAHRQPVGHGH